MTRTGTKKTAIVTNVEGALLRLPAMGKHADIVSVVKTRDQVEAAAQRLLSRPDVEKVELIYRTLTPTEQAKLLAPPGLNVSVTVVPTLYAVWGCYERTNGCVDYTKYRVLGCGVLGDEGIVLGPFAPDAAEHVVLHGVFYSYEEAANAYDRLRELHYEAELRASEKRSAR